ncbi:hypothetical protein [Paractinoplanes rishiriensis]|uniref:Uncharacterized protein n=1 Tax=Paractinoplanes rishiriensis TaxID=1050105 RepID=A0A919JWN0_9ACTN|nr:hypothetical protein [Actinoplanes rishiriensis]GIE94488.1 hypothetical protein Ari01nite_19530 [Actinoplanes rishiriensis]
MNDTSVAPATLTEAPTQALPLRLLARAVVLALSAAAAYVLLSALSSATAHADPSPGSVISAVTDPLLTAATEDLRPETASSRSKEAPKAAKSAAGTTLRDAATDGEGKPAPTANARAERKPATAASSSGAPERKPATTASSSGAPERKPATESRPPSKTAADEATADHQPAAEPAATPPALAPKLPRTLTPATASVPATPRTLSPPTPPLNPESRPQALDNSATATGNRSEDTNPRKPKIPDLSADRAPGSALSATGHHLAPTGPFLSPPPAQAVPAVTADALTPPTGESLPSPTGALLPEVTVPTQTGRFLPAPTSHLPPLTSQVARTLTSNLLPATTGHVLPTLTGQVLPAVTGNLLPTATGHVLPTLTGQVLPRVTGNLLPAATGNLLPALAGQVAAVVAPVVSAVEPALGGTGVATPGPETAPITNAAVTPSPAVALGGPATTTAVTAAGDLPAAVIAAPSCSADTFGNSTRPRQHGQAEAGLPGVPAPADAPHQEQPTGAPTARSGGPDTHSAGFVADAGSILEPIFRLVGTPADRDADARFPDVTALPG